MYSKAINDSKMGKEDRKEAILKFMRGAEGLERPIFSPTPLHFNLEERGATFSLATTRRLMQELAEEGKLRVLDEARGYYQITDRGLDDVGEPQLRFSMDVTGKLMQMLAEEGYLETVDEEEGRYQLTEQGQNKLSD
jgi:predicted transcriptional regulator